MRLESDSKHTCYGAAVEAALCVHRDVPLAEQQRAKPLHSLAISRALFFRIVKPHVRVNGETRASCLRADTQEHEVYTT